MAIVSHECQRFAAISARAVEQGHEGHDGLGALIVEVTSRLVGKEVSDHLQGVLAMATRCCSPPLS